MGYSGHAYVVADILLSLQCPILGYFDLEQKSINPFQIPYLGSEKRKADLGGYVKADVGYALGIGDNSLRRKADQYLMQFPWKAAIVKHPSSIIGKQTSIGDGTVVTARAVVNALASIGRGAIINTGAIIEHECKIGDYAHIAPGAVVAGNVHIGQRTFIGANATIKQGLEIGHDVIVGAGAVVLSSIREGETWVGNPARRIK